DIHANGGAGEAVELAGVVEKSGVATGANVGEDRSDDLLSLFEAGRLACDQRGGVFGFEDSDHHITILFRGYSTMPCAPASFSRGIMLRTVVSSRMVLTATHELSLRVETVGFLRAGRT